MMVSKILENYYVSKTMIFSIYNIFGVLVWTKVFIHCTKQCLHRMQPQFSIIVAGRGVGGGHRRRIARGHQEERAR